MCEKIASKFLWPALRVVCYYSPMKSILWFAIPAAAFAAAIPAACGDEIGFEEEFALAQDRGATLAKLVPGSNEFYFYSCLAAQQSGDLAESARLIAQWRRLGDGIGFPWLDRMVQRQKLLEADPENPDALGKFAKEFVREHDSDGD